MGKIGVFGDVVFEVSSEKVLTFSDFSRGGSGRWADHEIIGQKPVREFIGPGQEEITFTIRLDAQLGVNPEAELTKLRRIRDRGETRGLLFGNEPFRGTLWTLESLREQHKVIDGKGRLVTAIVELTLKEYPRLGGTKK